MSRYLVDSTGYAAFKRGHDGVKNSLQVASEILISPIVLGEIHHAICNSPDVPRQLRELNQFLDATRVALLPINEDTAERYGSIALALRQMGTPVPNHNIWVAASAMQYGAKVLTTDRHFLQIAQIRVDFHE